MGGFVLIRKAPGDNISATQMAALRAFAQMGMPAPCLIRRETYVLAVYPKRQATEPVLKQFPNGDFVCSCGTLIYDDLSGEAAATAFYRDYNGSPETRERAMGHYALLLCKGGQTEVILDSFGGYHVFFDAAKRIVSSSFLAVASALDRLTLGAQNACEYVFDGVIHGNDTLFDEISLAPVNATIVMRDRGFEILSCPPHIPEMAAAEPFEVMIGQSLELLDRYFKAVTAAFGNRVACALSGGYDSRLILALLRRHGTKPRVYVYGPPGDKDVESARAIAKGEGFPLDVVDKKQLVIPPSEFAAVALSNFLDADGYTWEGIFHNGVEHCLRASRVSGNFLALNGGAGEIWRNFFYLPDRSYSPREFIWSRWSMFDPRVCTSAFDENVYLDNLEDKLAVLIPEGSTLLPRPTIEWLYHNFRSRHWEGRINSINNEYGYAALAYCERFLTEHVSVIPMGWKNHGAYEAELIRRTDQRLAAYPSIYGHDFIAPPPLAHRLRDYATYLRPPWLRRFSYRVKHRAHPARKWPDYLRKDYRDAALPGGVQVMSELFQVDRVSDPAHAGRILTLEYLVKQFEGRIRVDFHHSSRLSYHKCAA